MYDYSKRHPACGVPSNKQMLFLKTLKSTDSSLLTSQITQDNPQLSNSPYKGTWTRTKSRLSKDATLTVQLGSVQFMLTSCPVTNTTAFLSEQMHISSSMVKLICYPALVVPCTPTVTEMSADPIELWYLRFCKRHKVAEFFK